jgi:hypothetical protein
VIVPTKIVAKEKDVEIALMLFPIFNEETQYEFQLVEFYESKRRLKKSKVYKEPLDFEAIGKEFGVKPEGIKELVDKLYSS